MKTGEPDRQNKANKNALCFIVNRNSPYRSWKRKTREPYANIEEPEMAYMILNHPKSHAA
jgi:hypothetical protein